MSGNCKCRQALITVFPLTASTADIAVEMVETIWQFDPESLALLHRFLFHGDLCIFKVLESWSFRFSLSCVSTV